MKLQSVQNRNFARDAKRLRVAMRAASSSAGAMAPVGASAFVIQNTTDAASNQVLILRSGRRGSPTDNDEGYISLQCDDDNTSDTAAHAEFARITWKATDVTNNSKDGQIEIAVMVADSLTDAVIIVDDRVGLGLTPTANMAGLSIEAGVVTIKETTTPTADADYGKIYTKNDNKLYFQDGAGNEHEIAFV